MKTPKSIIWGFGNRDWEGCGTCPIPQPRPLFYPGTAELKLLPPRLWIWTQSPRTLFLNPNPRRVFGHKPRASNWAAGWDTNPGPGFVAGHTNPGPGFVAGHTNPGPGFVAGPEYTALPALIAPPPQIFDFHYFLYVFMKFNRVFQWIFIHYHTFQCFFNNFQTFS